MPVPDMEPRALVEGPGLIESIRQYWRPSAVLIVLFALAGLAYTSMSSVTYSATATVALVDPPNSNGAVGVARYTDQQSSFAQSDQVLKPAAKTLGMSVAALRAAVDTSSSLTSNLIHITGNAGDRQQAANRADAVALSLRDTLGATADKQKKDKLARLEARKAAEYNSLSTTGGGNSPREQVLIATANAAIQQIDAQENAIEQEAVRFGNGVQFINPAIVPAKSGLKAALIPGFLAAVVGFVIALVGSWILADRRRRIEDSAVPGIVVGARLLGEIPLARGAKARALTKFENMPTPAFSFAAAGLGASFDTGIVLFSGVERAAGSTTSAANIAAAFARDGRRVVIIDADGKERSLSRLTGTAESTAGLSDVLTGRAPIEDSLRAIDLGDGVALAMVPAGRQEPDFASLLRTRTMGELLHRLREWYDLIVIDCPPLTTAPEGASLARYADGIVAVVARNTSLRGVDRLRARLELLDVDVLGYVFNRDQATEAVLHRASRSDTRV